MSYLHKGIISSVKYCRSFKVSRMTNSWNSYDKPEQDVTSENPTCAYWNTKFNENNLGKQPMDHSPISNGPSVENENDNTIGGEDTTREP